MITIWKKVGIISTGIIVLMIPLSLLLHRPSTNLQKEEAQFVGGKECISCHQREYELWKGSNHDNAMDIATDSIFMVGIVGRDRLTGIIRRIQRVT